MRTVLAYPGNMAHAQNTGLALLEANSLDAFVTSFVWQSDGPIASALATLPHPAIHALRRQLRRRGIAALPPAIVHSYPLWEFIRTATEAAFHNAVATDLAWDEMSHRFDALVARRYVAGTQAIQVFEYTALAAFKRAKQLGVACILHLPSLDSLSYEDVQHREKSHNPELVGRHDAYFDAKFQRRYDRRRQEIELADVIIANSSLTARSHIAAGADPRKIFAVPLGAPPAIAVADLRPGSLTEPMKVVWAGPFSLRKGAHYLLEAWKKLAAGRTAQLDVYGVEALPKRLLASYVPGIVFHGSVPQLELFRTFRSADLLVFPTLSDGFGMVVAEAMAHGLPVITTDQAGAADLITPENGLIVKAADAAALTDALRWCLDNRQKLANMRLPALEAAAKRPWSAFRRDLVLALTVGLSRRDFTPNYLLPL